MSEFLRLLLEFIEFLWPLRRVEQWEGGGYYLLGRWQAEVQPGVHWVIPWFMDVKTISKAEAIIGTGRKDITLSDGSLCSFAANATARVVNVNLALNKVDDYKETAQELLAAVVAERLAAVDAMRLTHEKRGRLFADLSRWVAEEAAEYGLEVRKVRFDSFMINVRAYRLINDQAVQSTW